MIGFDMTSILFFLAALPVIIILMIVYRKDRKKEPFTLLIQFFFLGIVSCFLVIGVSDILEVFFPFMEFTKDSSFLDILLYSFIGVALVEELCKWVMVYFKGYNNREFDEIFDIMVYSVFVSLGFAFFENIIYVFGTRNFTTALMRALSAVPGHACDAIFMGYYLCLAKKFQSKGNNQLEKRNIALSIIIPTILHGIYDYCLMSNIKILVYVFIIFIIILYTISIRKLNEISSTSFNINKKNNFCYNCGAKVEGHICSKCGAPQD